MTRGILIWLAGIAALYALFTMLTASNDDVLVDATPAAVKPCQSLLWLHPCSRQNCVRRVA